MTEFRLDETTQTFTAWHDPEQVEYIGIGGTIRSVKTDMDLGVGTRRGENQFDIRRAIWDAAFGYVSGFRKRDIIYYIVTRSLSRRLCNAVLDWEKTR